ncbi:hypothetical protein R1flu_022264 [Riccia fluitans]|uniref:DSBA-like thioredoxin domain-containing protein n=1 Tax=Riccia fluitans TaxID=41844 RepID=A0ABD1ZRP0_9MARC
MWPMVAGASNSRRIVTLEVGILRGAVRKSHSKSPAALSRVDSSRKDSAVNSYSAMATPATARTVINIDAWSDVACPWCYVGKTRLDLALKSIQAKAQTPPIVVKWHPYMIDKKTKAEGEEYLAYNTRRWGSDGWTHDLRRSGAKNGLKFANWRWWPNTLNAHRLILFADTYGKGEDAKQLLLLKTYEEGANVSDFDVLCSVANELGLPGADEYLKSGGGTEEVLAQDSEAKSRLGIRSVPHFKINNIYTLSGAQDVATFVAAISKAISHLNEN